MNNTIVTQDAVKIDMKSVVGKPEILELKLLKNRSFMK